MCLSGATLIITVHWEFTWQFENTASSLRSLYGRARSLKPHCHSDSCQMVSCCKVSPRYSRCCVLVPLFSSSWARREGPSDGWWINQFLLAPDVPNLKWWMRKSGPCESNGIHRPASGLYLCAALDLCASAVMRPVKCRPRPQRQWKEKCFTHDENNTPPEYVEVIAFTAATKSASEQQISSQFRETHWWSHGWENWVEKQVIFFPWHLEKEFPARSEQNTKLKKRLIKWVRRTDKKC